MKKLILLIAALSLSSYANAVDIDSLLVQSIGGPDALKTVRNLKTCRTEGTVNLNGMPGTFVDIYLAPDKLYHEVTLGEIKLVQAFDGKITWQRDHNGRISQLTGFERDELIKNLYLESFAFVLDSRLPGDARLVGETEFQSKTWYEVEIYPLLNDTLTLLLDKETARRKFLFTRLDHLKGVTEFDDFRTVDGVEIPFVNRTEFEGAPIFANFETATAAFNVEIDESIFTMPTAAKPDFAFAQNTDSVRLQFDYHRGHIWLPAVINGKKKAWFILDSGASANLFHDASVTDLNMPPVGSMPAMGLGGYDDIPIVRTDSIEIGDLTLINQVAGTIDIAAIGIRPPEGKIMGGILGHDFLSRFPVKVNFFDSSVTVYNPVTFTPPANGIEVPFELTLLVPTVHGAIAGIEGDFIVDMGNALGLVLHKQFYETHRLDTILTDIDTFAGTAGGLGGSSKLLTASAPSFSFGNIDLTDVPTVIPESSHGLAGSGKIAGNIGLLILKDFPMLFDYDNNRIIIYPPDEL